MDRITHRQLRNDSAEVLRRVASGESFEVTNHGVVTAILSPAGATSALDRLRRAGRVRAADRSVDLRSIERRPATESSADILADARGRS